MLRTQRSKKLLCPTRLVLLIGLTSATMMVKSAAAEDAVREGWINSSHPITCLNEKRPDGRLVTITVNNGICPRKGIHGAIFHVYLQGYTPKHVAIPASQLDEYDIRKHLVSRNLRFGWSDVTNWVNKVKDWIERAIKFVDKLRDLTNPIKQLVRAVCELMSELGLDWCEKINDVAGSGPVVVFTGNVKAAALNGGLPSLDQKIAWSIQATLNSHPPAVRRKLVQQFHAGVIDQL